MFGWTADEQASFALLDRFVGQGFDAIDTADVYSAWAPGHAGGESETIIGRWLAQRGRRDDVVLMTKVGMSERRKGLRAANVEAALEDSLARLRTDYVDVYFAHVNDDHIEFHRMVWGSGDNFSLVEPDRFHMTSMNWSSGVVPVSSSYSSMPSE